MVVLKMSDSATYLRGVRREDIYSDSRGNDFCTKRNLFGVALGCPYVVHLFFRCLN